ncbi:MAG TPA: type II toxin-antitoxin system VapC family toxin [Planctomycetaceae bacterium]|nr:type II toxin-antitoxin system VapC family toxin [Planctomycetaceae bacterium]
MKYLVDSNVLSEPTKPAPDPNAVDWLRRNEPELAVNPIVLGELEYGILLLPAGKRRTGLQQWFTQAVRRIRVLDWDAATAAEWARLLARLKKANRAMSVKDSLIAATALAHGLTLATRNTKDFKHAGVPLVNPFVP